jgi:hypothetical protein
MRCCVNDTERSPWWVVDADDKHSSRLNVMTHLLSMVSYERPVQVAVEIPERHHRDYERPPKETQRFAPRRYRVKNKSGTELGTGRR